MNERKYRSYKALAGLNVSALIYPDGEFWLGKEAPVVDEGAFYRIDGTHIIDKARILAVEEGDGRVTVKMKDTVVVLIGEK